MSWEVLGIGKLEDETKYLRRGLDIALDLLSDSDLEEWNSRMEEE